MVARICVELQLRGDEKVLDVGTGSGYQAAVLAELAAEVHSLERIPDLPTVRAPRSTPRATPAGSTYTTSTAPSVCPGEGRSAAPPAAATGGLPPALLEDSSTLAVRLVIPIGPHHQQFLRVYVQTPRVAADFAALPCRFVPLVHDG